MVKYSIMPLFILVTIVLGALGIGFMHEQVHVAIYRGYGIESHVEYLSHFPDFVTIAEEGCPTEECRLAHNINEVVGYTFLPIYIVFSLLLFYIILQKEEMIALKYLEREEKYDKKIREKGTY